MVWGDAVSKLKTFVWILSHISRSKTWSLFPPKSIILGQMINLDMIFHVVVSVYRVIKIWNSPQFPVEFRNGLSTRRLLVSKNPFPFFYTIAHRFSAIFIQSSYNLGIELNCACPLFKEARKGFSLLYRLWNEGRLQRRTFTDVGKLCVSLQLYCWSIL